jgi:hypothetical protein
MWLEPDIDLGGVQKALDVGGLGHGSSHQPSSMQR